MGRGRGYIAAFGIAFLCAGLYTAESHPAMVQATVPTPGIITTYAGGLGSGPGTSIAQGPWGLAREQ